MLTIRFECRCFFLIFKCYLFRLIILDVLPEGHYPPAAFWPRFSGQKGDV